MVEGDAERRFREAMSDDFNTPEAIAVLQALARDLNNAKSAGRSDEARVLAARLRTLGGILGLVHRDAEDWFKKASGATASGPTDAQIDEWIAARAAARKARNWAESDRLRDQLAAAGVALEDGPKGTTWRRK